MKQGHASSQAMQKALREREKELREREASDLRVVLSTEPGRRFVTNLIANRLRVFSKVPTGGDGLRVEGARDAGIELMADIQEIDAKSYSQMWCERFVGDVEEQQVRAALKSTKDEEYDET